MVLAGPGSGKTFVITRRIKHLIEVQNVPAKQIGVITFTKAAALEMKERAVSVCKEASQAAFGTFHSFFYQILRSYSQYSRFTIITENEKTQILRQILYTRYSNIHVINQKIPSLKNQISYYINTNCIPEDCFEVEEFHWVFQQYKRECLSRERFDFDLILSECLHLLQTNEPVKRRWQEYFQYFLVDEYQDTNNVQFQIMNLLAEKHRNLFVVGDDDQSIYGFRGADPKIMFRFLEIYQDATQITLKENFRSKKTILDLASQSISNNKTRFEKHLYCHSRENGEVHFLKGKDREEEVDLLIKNILQRKSEGAKEEEIAILCRTTNLFPYLCMKLKKAGILFEKRKETNQFYEAESVQDILAYLRFVFKGRKRKDLFQVLNRPERSLSRMFFETEIVDLADVRKKYMNVWEANEKSETSLGENGVMESNFMKGDYMKRDSIKSDSIKSESMKSDSMNLYESVKKNFMKHSFMENNVTKNDYMDNNSMENNEVLSKLLKLEKDVQMLESLDAYGCICYILYGMGYEAYCLSGKNALEQEQEREILEELKLQAKIYGNISKWLEAVEYMQTEDNKAEKKSTEQHQGVKLLTYHASKGLEYPHVYIPFLNEYIVPHKKAVSTEEIEEERRMFYVAMTRAKDSLTLSYVSGKGNAPSLFVEELQENKRTRDEEPVMKSS